MTDYIAEWLATDPRLQEVPVIPVIYVSQVVAKAFPGVLGFHYGVNFRKWEPTEYER